MRQYKSKDDVQKKSYYSDRFFVSPNLPRKEVNDDEIFLKDYEFLSSKLELEEAYIEHTHLVIHIKKDDIVKIVNYLKYDMQYDMLVELSAIDYISTRNGFEIFYEFLSMDKHKRLRVKTFLQKNEKLESITSLFKSANWSEREMYDMFGIKIINHPNMKRLLMPDDWYDYPLKKTYPLQGDETASWYEVDKIFGKEARDIVGAEQRDPASIDRYDTTRFARLGHEVPFDTDVSVGEEKTDISYQEENITPVMKKFKKEESVVLKRRR